MFEHRHEGLLPAREFARRLLRHAGLASAVIFGSLLFVWFEGLTWVDGFLNAAMILGGMGPVATIQTTGGKIFAGLYALYSGLVFLVAAGILLAPLFHRVMHRFHLGDEERARPRAGGGS
jgi:hypothetical protein